MACFEQKLRLSRPTPPVGSIHYILATGWEGSPFHGFADKARARGWPTREIDCGHDVMLDRPDELTAALLEIAEN
jgi:hypothetical protein